MILADSGFDIVLIIGPTGVGKTSVLNALYKRINQQYESEMKNNPGFIPCIKFEVPEPGPRQFAWSTFYMEPLAQLNDPLIGRKAEVICDGGVTKVKPNTSKASVAALQKALLRGLELRRTRVVIIDEAAHLLGHAHGEDLLNVTNALKHMANGKTTLVLSGSYDLLKLMRLNGQLCRRTCVVHFDRYRNTKDGSPDATAFGNSLDQLQKAIPTVSKPNLIPYASALQEACLGCVGILKEVLQRALANYLDEGNGAEWTIEQFQDALLPKGTIDKIREETLNGEKEIVKYISANSLLNPQGIHPSDDSESIPSKSTNASLRKTGMKRSA
jgi:hypothetical protein